MILTTNYTTKRPEVKAPYLDPGDLPHDERVDKLTKRYLGALGAYVKDREARRRVPGAAVMVRQNCDIIHVNCYGFANLETGEKVTPNTLFDLGSLSKQFTAIGALNLVINGEFDRDAELSHIFYNSPYNFPRYADVVTVDELIHHTSALPEYFDIFAASREVNDKWYDNAMITSDDWYPQMAKRAKPELTNKDMVRLIASQRLLPREPNTEFEYSNSGYVVLAEVIEHVAEMRLADYLKEQIFDPLAMDSTYVFDERPDFRPDAPEIVNHAICYNRTPDRGFIPIGYTPLNFVYGDGNIHSNILDLTRWDYHLHGLDHAAICARNERQEEAAQRVRNMLWDPVLIRGRRRVNYGAGWNLFRSKYEKTFEQNGKRFTKMYESHGEYHRGEWLGWRSYIARAARWEVPKRGKDIDPNTWDSLGIVVLSNNNQFNVDRIAREISQIFWGPLKKDNIMNSF